MSLSGPLSSAPTPFSTSSYSASQLYSTTKTTSTSMTAQHPNSTATLEPSNSVQPAIQSPVPPKSGDPVNPAGVAIGIAFGVIVILIASIVTGYYHWKKRQAKRSQKSETVGRVKDKAYEAMIDFNAFQDVECVYPMSGQYGRAPRALYYSLLLFVVVFRRQGWLTAGAAAFCLTFGGSAAIHACILAPILSLGKPPIPDGVVQLSNSTKIKITPLALDLDNDATLAIVGTGFFIVIPMALCPGYNDTLPFSGNPAPLINNSWNDTIWTYFETQNPSFPSCVYPCLSAAELLRQPGDNRVVHFLDLHQPAPLYWGLDIVSAVIYGCVPLTLLFSLVIFVLRICGYTSDMNFKLLDKADWTTKTRIINVWAVNVYGKILTPFMFVIFLVWVEWIIAYDLQSESMQLVGQWAPLVGAALVFVAAVVGKYLD